MLLFFSLVGAAGLLTLPFKPLQRARAPEPSQSSCPPLAMLIAWPFPVIFRVINARGGYPGNRLFDTRKYDTEGVLFGRWVSVYTVNEYTRWRP
jgi:hypothetical protein